MGGDRNLYRFDLGTGAATLIGPTGITGHADGLVWDSARDTLVALTANFGGADLYAVNVATGPTNSYSRTTLDSGLGPHTCIAYVR